MKEIPYLNIDVPADSTESKNKIMDNIIQSLPANNDRYYMEHEDGSNTSKIREDLLQNEKDDLFQLTLNADIKLHISKKKADQTKLKRIRNQATQMFEEVGESFADL